MQNTDPIIEVKNVSMRFNLAKERTDTVKEYIVKLREKRLLTYNPSLASKKRYEINRMVEKAKSLFGKRILRLPCQFFLIRTKAACPLRKWKYQPSKTSP